MKHKASCKNARCFFYAVKGGNMAVIFYSSPKEERIQQIKDCGQSIINNADSIYGNYEFPQGLKIIIDMPIKGAPTITLERNFAPECFVERLR